MSERIDGWIVYIFLHDSRGQRIIYAPELRHAHVSDGRSTVYLKLSRWELFMIGCRTIWAAIMWKRG